MTTDLTAPTTARWRAIGTRILVAVTDDRRLDAAQRIVSAEIDAADRAYSRFRDDSELAHIDSVGGPTTVSEHLVEVLTVALRVAQITDGLVDPTIGACLDGAGYDRDFDDVVDSVVPLEPRAAPGWQCIGFDAQTRRLSLPRGVRLDFGAVGKALIADRAAARIARELDTGALVDLGGDIAVNGTPPEDGWAIRVTEYPDDSAGVHPGQTVRVTSGGLATSSTMLRSWHRAGERVHHILDPRTGRPAGATWRTVTVAAASCVDANAASTASIVRGLIAPAWLADLGLPARLVSVGGRVVITPAWPSEKS